MAKKSDPIAGFSRYDAMDTHELEELLRQDAEAPEGAGIEMDELLYIMEVVARRQQAQPGGMTDVHTAWARFQEEYLSEDRHSETVLELPAQAAPKPPKKRMHWSLRTAAAVLAVVLCLFTADITASAFGVDLWQTIVKWSGETFGFAVPTEKETYYGELPEQLAELNETILEHGFASKNLLPAYIPDGYDQASVVTTEDNYCMDITCMLSNGSNSIILQYRLYFDGGNSTFEKDLTDPETYTAGGIQHFIATNEDEFVAVWQTNDIECSIQGVETKDELIKMIDSIYGG